MYKIDSDGYVLFAQSQVPIYDDFLKTMDVSSGSFAAKILKYIYSEIYIWSTDLKKEYINYYSIEYDTFEKYLHYMVGVDFNGIDLEKEHIFYFKPGLEFLDLAYDGNYFDTVMSVLEKDDEN